MHDISRTSKTNGKSEHLDESSTEKNEKKKKKIKFAISRLLMYLYVYHLLYTSGVSPRQPMAPSPYYQQSPDTGPQQSPGYAHGPGSIQSNSSPAAFTPGSPAQQLLQNNTMFSPNLHGGQGLGGQG